MSLKESISSLKIYLQKNRFLKVNGSHIHINLSRCLGRIEQPLSTALLLDTPNDAT
jgi:hypothetical protein